MFKQDSSSFAELITGLGEIYRWEFSPATIEIYWRILEPFSLEDVRAAIYRHIQDPDAGKYLPKPADIIMAIEGSSQNRALTAWSKTSYAMRTVGKYTSIAFDDPLIHAVIADMNGWVKLCDTEIKQLPFVAKEFQERYRAYVVKKPSHYRKYLPGLIEARNTAFDTYILPKLIGNESKAKEVIANGDDEPILKVTALPTKSTNKELVKHQEQKNGKNNKNNNK